jgi:hypothetical protein
LVASYPSHEVAVPVPSSYELDQLRAEVTARISAADTAVAADPPAAIVGEHCGLCGVRGLCDAYWTAGITRTADVPDGGWYDLSGTVAREHGVKSWMVREASTGAEVLVRTPTPSFALPLGRSIRVIGAKRAVDPDQEGALIAALASLSEVLQVTR